MRDTLYIRLGADACGAPHDTPGDAWWRAPEGPGGTPGPVRRGALEEAAAAAAACRVVVLVPGERVLFSHARLPTRQRQRMLRAVPYALEEQLAEDVERLHFALGAQDAERGVAVAVIARACMDHWLEALRGAGIHADALIPDTLMLPWEPGTWTGLLEPHRVILRTGAQDGLAADPGDLVELLDLTLREVREKDGEADREALPEHIRLFVDPALGPPAGLEALPVPVAVEESPDGPLGLLPAAADGVDPTRRAIHLLQGAYSRREQLGRLWRPWRVTAALLGAWLLVGAGLQVYQYFDLRARTAASSREIVQLYRRTFPNDHRVVNARAQMEHHLEEMRRRRGAAAGGFLALLGKAGAALQKSPGITLQAVAYRGGGLDLRVAARDMQGLDRLRKALAGRGGLNVDLQSASTRNGRVESRLRIRDRGS